jgi:CPA2 family monovalent cation:H+ antiporter-2
VFIGGVALLFGNRLEIALLLDVVFSLSSTAMVMQQLAQQLAMPTPMGQAIFSILMLQDFAVVSLWILVDLLGRQTNDNLVVGITLFKSIGVLLLIFFVLRRVVARVFRYFAQQRQPEVFMALTLFVALGIAGATAAPDLSLGWDVFLDYRVGIRSADHEGERDRLHHVERPTQPGWRVCVCDHRCGGQYRLHKKCANTTCKKKPGL